MNPMTDSPQSLIGDLGRTTGMFLNWFYNLKLKHTNEVWKFSIDKVVENVFHADVGPRTTTYCGASLVSTR